MSVPQYIRFTFDIDMLRIPNNPLLIRVRWANNIKTLSYINWVSPTILLCNIIGSTPNPGPNTTTFAGAIMDIFSVEGIAAEKWTDIPITSFP